MKERVLHLLKESSPEFISGEIICRNLGISRTAVWKHIQTLRASGYEIAALPHAGYQLLGVPDRLYPEEIRDGLDTEFIGRKVYYYEHAISTNETARELADRGCPDGALVIAEEQSGGKGRLGRNWFSPYGKGIWFSIVLFPPVNPSDAPTLTMLGAVAVARAIRKIANVEAGIKWPNDILLDGKKICGILSGMSAEIERINYLIIGIGINVNVEEFPSELEDTVTSLKIYTGQPVKRTVLLQEILMEIEQLYKLWLQNGFQPILRFWKEMCVMLNKMIRVNGIKDVFEGWAEDVDDRGNLILRLEDGSLKGFVAGDVSLQGGFDLQAGRREGSSL